MNRCKDCYYYRPLMSDHRQGGCNLSYVASGKLHNTDLSFRPFCFKDGEYQLLVYDVYGCVHWKSKPLEKEVMIGNHKWRIILDPKFDDETIDFKDNKGKTVARLVNVSKAEDIPY
jgi:hypothetical protein